MDELPCKKRKRTKRSVPKEDTKREYEHLSPEQVQALGGTKWEERRCRYHTHTQLGRDGEQINKYAYSYEDALGNERWRVAQGGTTRVQQRAAAKKRLADNESKRAQDCAKHGGTCALERNTLVKIRDFVRHKRTAGGICFHINPDFCLADSTYRTSGMGPDAWLEMQLKVATERKSSAGTPVWDFGKVGGYPEGMLVVCVCDDKMWVFDGSELKMPSLEITEGGKWDKRLTMEGLYARLVQRCAAVQSGTTLYKSEHTFRSVSHSLERWGIDQYVRFFYKGFAPIADELYDAGREADLEKALDERKTVSGDQTVSFPIDEQNGKTDLVIGAKMQYKTAQRNAGRSGWHVNMQTRQGKDAKGRIRANAYREGDNDFYVVVAPQGVDERPLFWRIPEKEMIEHNLVGDGELLGSFSVYEADSTVDAPANGWTKKYQLIER
jgi:hypothetical protein